MRRTQQRLRPAGLRIALPAGDIAELEKGLRVGADPSGAESVDLGLRMLSTVVRRALEEPPAVLAVRLREKALEILVDPSRGPTIPVSPFESGTEESCWLLRWNSQQAEALRCDPEVVGVDAPTPSLVTLGRDERGLLMVNLETAGSVEVSGPDADLMVQAMAVELATAPWTEEIDLVLVTTDIDRPGLERVSHASSLRTVTAKVERRIRERTAFLAMERRATNADGRWTVGGDLWDLCVVVCSREAADRDRSTLDRLVGLAGDGSLGVLVICASSGTGARWQVSAEGGRVHVRGLAPGLPSVSRQPVPPNLSQGVAALLSVAAQTAGVGGEADPYARLTMPIPQPARVPPHDDDRPVLGRTTGVREASDDLSERRDIDEAGVVVNVLGPIEVLGAARPFTRAWAIELVVYLSMHPGGAKNEQWTTALWPDRAMAPASLHSTASAARRSLGESATGEDHLPRSRGRLMLGSGVRTDWAAFVKLAESDRPGDWKAALALIRGRPFDGLRSPDWVILEGIQATIEAVVVDLACRHAEYLLEIHDAAGAEWAARQGLRVSPYDERLYRILLRVADAAGNPAGVEAIMAELTHVVADDVEPFDTVHPETLALYRSLSRRPLIARGR
jgi:hypothetical protein